MSEPINWCNLKENVKHLGEVVTSRQDGKPNGAAIQTSTDSVTGKTRDTLDTKLNKFDTQLSKQDADFNANINRQDQIFQDRFSVLEPVEWTATTLVTNPLQVYKHTVDGVERTYLPDPTLVPFTTEATFADDAALNRWVASDLLTRMQNWRDIGDVRGWGGNFDYYLPDGSVNPSPTDNYEAFTLAAARQGMLVLPTGAGWFSRGVVIKDSTITRIDGAGDGSTSLVFSNTITTTPAVTVETYYARKLVITGCSIIPENALNEMDGLLVKQANGDWGVGIKLNNTSIKGFNKNIVQLHEAYNSEFENCLITGVIQAGGSDKGTCLKFTNSSDFGNNVKFRNCMFWMARIGIDNPASTTLSFDTCGFENLKLFNTTPQLGGVSMYQSYDNCWFENIGVGLINAKLDYDTLSPVMPVTNRSWLSRILFKNCMTSGSMPEKFLNSAIEPYWVNNFHVSLGMKEATATETHQKLYEEILPVPDDPEAVTQISRNIPIGDLLFRGERWRHGSIKFIVRATGLNEAVMSATLETSSFFSPCVVVGGISDTASIGHSWKIDGRYDSADSYHARIRVWGKGLYKLEVLYSTVS